MPCLGDSDKLFALIQGETIKANVISQSTSVVAPITTYGEARLSELRRVTSVLGVLLALLCPGCAMYELEQDLEVIEEIRLDIDGCVQGETSGDHPVLVVLLREDEEAQWQVFDYFVQYHPGAFEFLTSGPARCRVVAFEDANQDFVYQSGETAGMSQPADIRASRADVLIELRENEGVLDGLPLNLSRSEDSADLAVTRANNGVVVPLEDERFHASHGDLGIWEPMEFSRRRLSGIYFLEDYDHGKVPVLFFHGIGGTPKIFDSMVERLDRERFQPWFVFYPSAHRLDLVTYHLANMIKELHARHKFERMAVVAHSMGGLVAGATMQELSKDDHSEYLKSFVTLATPWGGHPSVRSALEYSPVVAPRWYDLAPGSPFMKGLHAGGLPNSIEAYSLLFCFVGDSMLMEGCV